MKFTLIIDKDREEELVLYLKEKSELADRVKSVISESTGILGYDGVNVTPLSPCEIYAIFLEDSKLYAMTRDKKYRLKMRLYEAEALIGNGFVKINQSCIVRLDKIQKFETKFSGSLSVLMKNGYRDYVSRRQISAVKSSLGIK